MIGKLLSGAAAKVLAALDSPATGSDIVLGKEAYDSNGDKITGTLESINNPWKPSSQSEYDTIVESKNKVGNYIEYSGKTTKVMPEVLSGTFAVGDVVETVYFDTTKSPYLTTTGWDVEDVNIANSTYVRIKYLMVGDETVTISGAEIKKGLVYISDESNSNNYLVYDTTKSLPLYVGGTGWGITPGWIFDNTTFEDAVTLTTVEPNTVTNWNGSWAFKVHTPQYAKEYYANPTLTNEGTASDLALGKQLINSQGAIVTGTKSDTPVAATGDYFVKVIDYDGTVLLDTRGDNGDSFDLPTAPSHEGLVFQEWSASCPIVDGKVTIDNNNIMAGAVYTTASGQNEFDITLTKVTGLSVTLNMNGTKDWGDGTNNTETTHTYTEHGDYTIKCSGTTMTASSDSGLFGQNGNSINYSIVATRLSSTILKVSGYAFQYCYSLREVCIPNGKIVESDAFQYCKSLTSIVFPKELPSITEQVLRACSALVSIVIPNTVTNFQATAMGNCYALETIVIPDNTTRLYDSVFSNCYNLGEIICLKKVTTIGSRAFSSGYRRLKYDFSQSTSVPTLMSSLSFQDINQLCKIIVPDSLYDEWIAATNWSTYADYIYKASEVA